MLIYAGGDDVMALVSVDDLLACLTLLRAAYGGLPMPKALSNALARSRRTEPAAVIAVFGDRLIRLMGEQAIASAGAVIAHHTAPLELKLRELRRSERRAKNKGWAQCLRHHLCSKRSGGATELTLPWNLDAPTSRIPPMQLLAELQNTFRCRHVAQGRSYLTQDWLFSLPLLGAHARRRSTGAAHRQPGLSVQSPGAKVQRATFWPEVCCSRAGASPARYSTGRTLQRPARRGRIPGPRRSQ